MTADLPKFTWPDLQGSLQSINLAFSFSLSNGKKKGSFFVTPQMDLGVEVLEAKKEEELLVAGLNIGLNANRTFVGLSFNTLGLPAFSGISKACTTQLFFTILPNHCICPLLLC